MKLWVHFYRSLTSDSGTGLVLKNTALQTPDLESSILTLPSNLRPLTRATGTDLAL